MNLNAPSECMIHGCSTGRSVTIIKTWKVYQKLGYVKKKLAQVSVYRNFVWISFVNNNTCKFFVRNRWSKFRMKVQSISKWSELRLKLATINIWDWAFSRIIDNDKRGIRWKKCLIGDLKKGLALCLSQNCSRFTVLPSTPNVGLFCDFTRS